MKRHLPSFSSVPIDNIDTSVPHPAGTNVMIAITILAHVSTHQRPTYADLVELDSQAAYRQHCDVLNQYSSSAPKRHLPEPWQARLGSFLASRGGQ
jgi:hypothetical protein